MGIRDVFHFNERAYIIKVRNSHTRTLRKKHHSKIRLRHASAFSIGWGIGFAPATCGISLFGCMYSLRQRDILLQQANIIEMEIALRGEEVPRRRKRDWVYGVLIGCTGVCVGIWIGHFFCDLIDPVTGGLTSAAGTAGVHAVPSMEAAQAAASNIPSAIHGATQGVSHVFSTEFHHAYPGVDGFNANTTFMPPSGNTAFLGGEQLAVSGMNSVQRFIGNATAQTLLENHIYNAERPHRSCE